MQRKKLLLKAASELCELRVSAVMSPAFFFGRGCAALEKQSSRAWLIMFFEHFEHAVGY